MARLFTLVVLLAWAGCDGSNPPADDPAPAPLQAAPLVVAAGAQQIEPVPGAPWAAGVDLARLGLDRVDLAYDLTTPANDAFVFDLLTRAEANAGEVRISLAHASDGGAQPNGGPESLALAGVVADASGAGGRGVWLDATGDGFARVSLRGAVDREQVIAVEVADGTGETTALVRLTVGPASAINVPVTEGTDYPGVVEQQLLYSSDSWNFGLPAVAVSGDRTSIVCYEGDGNDPFSRDRYELRMQYEGATGAVTGGGSVGVGFDSGHWRDHEIAALFNVLAVVRSGSDAVTMRISFDRGATFGQERTLAVTGAGRTARLAQVAIAGDYTLAAIFWEPGAGGTSRLTLVEGAPALFDDTGSPIQYVFNPPVTLYSTALDVVPIIMGAAYSDGGDLVVGYGFTSFQSERILFTTRTEFHVAVRHFGGTFFDTLVEEDIVVGRDPSVSLLGSGDAMRIFYAYEGRDGVRLRTSADGGRSFSDPTVVGNPNSHLPSVFARAQGDATRVDLLYLTSAPQGTELHLRHWDNFDSDAPAADFRLTTATMEQSDSLPPGTPVPGSFAIAPPDGGFRITQVSWLGYDAALDGDDVVIAVNERTFDAWTIYLGGPPVFDVGVGDPVSAPGAEGGFRQAEPPPLAEGMTEALPPPNPDQLNRLKRIVID